MTRYAILAAVVWIAQIAAAGHAYAWTAMPIGPPGPTTTPPAPVPLTTGHGLPLRWIAVGITGTLCLLLLAGALTLALHDHMRRRTARSTAPITRLRGIQPKG